MWINNCTKGTAVADRSDVANSFWRRLKGLLGTTSLEAGGGLVIRPCSSVHTFGMAYSIDVLFMNDEDQIIKIVAAMEPGRMAWAVGSQYVIELPKGCAERSLCAVGDILEIK